MTMERNAKTPAIAFAATVCRNISEASPSAVAVDIMVAVSMETSKLLPEYVTGTSVPVLAMWPGKTNT